MAQTNPLYPHGADEFELATSDENTEAASAATDVTLDRSGAPLGPSGLAGLAPSIAADQITHLNLARCSVGREWVDGQWNYTARGLIPLALHGRRLVSLDLSHNDLEADAVGTLGRGWQPEEATVQALSTRSTAALPSPAAPSLWPTVVLRTLILDGNSIGNDGTFQVVRGQKTHVSN